MMSEANAYYQSLLQQGYDVEQARVYTREHFPDFVTPGAAPQPTQPVNQQSSVDPMMAMMMMNQQNQQMMMQQQEMLAQSQQNQASGPVIINNTQQQSVVGGVAMSGKTTQTGYLLWLLCFVAICGAHRFYYNKPVSGVIYLLTFGIFGFGQLYDLLVMPELARTAHV